MTKRTSTYYKLGEWLADAKGIGATIASRSILNRYNERIGSSFKAYQDGREIGLFTQADYERPDDGQGYIYPGD